MFHLHLYSVNYNVTGQCCANITLMQVIGHEFWRKHLKLDTSVNTTTMSTCEILLTMQKWKYVPSHTK